METLLEELKLPEGNEKASDFDIFVQLIVSARILRFTNNCEKANEVARKWASIITASFENGTFSQETYNRQNSPISKSNLHKGCEYDGKCGHRTTRRYKFIQNLAWQHCP